MSHTSAALIALLRLLDFNIDYRVACLPVSGVHRGAGGAWLPSGILPPRSSCSSICYSCSFPLTFLRVAWCDALRNEIEQLHLDGQLYSNKTYHGGRLEGGKFSYSLALAKPHVDERDLMLDSGPERARLPHLVALGGAIREAVAACVCEEMVIPERIDIKVPPPPPPSSN